MCIVLRDKVCKRIGQYERSLVGASLFIIWDERNNFSRTKSVTMMSASKQTVGVQKPKLIINSQQYKTNNSSHFQFNGFQCRVITVRRSVVYSRPKCMDQGYLVQQTFDNCISRFNKKKMSASSADMIRGRPSSRRASQALTVS